MNSLFRAAKAANRLWRTLTARPVLRVWKLGSMEHRIFPTPESVQRLAGLLTGADGDAVDLIWGPELDVVELDGLGDNLVLGVGVKTTQVGPHTWVIEADVQQESGH